MSKESLETLIAMLDNWAAFFTLLVVVGVGGELIVHVMQSRANKKLVGLQHVEAIAQEAEIARMKKESASFELDIAKTKKGAADALERAAKAEENLGQFNARAALAEQHAAEANLELAKLKAPRKISPEQQGRIKLAVQEFKGTPFDMAAATDSEAADLATQIEDILVAAGWSQVGTPGTVTLQREGKKSWGIAIQVGISVEINQSRLGDLLKPTDALVGALRKEGWEIKGLATLVGNTPDAVHIRVGKKF